CSSLMVAGLDHFLKQRWCHIKSASFKNKRHDSETRFEGVAGLVSGLPEPIVSGHVTVIRTQRLEAVTQQREMSGFVVGHFHPAVEEAARYGFGGKTGNNVERKIDGVQLDMSEGMHQSDTPVFRVE